MAEHTQQEEIYEQEAARHTLQEVLYVRHCPLDTALYSPGPKRPTHSAASQDQGHQDEHGQGERFVALTKEDNFPPNCRCQLEGKVSHHYKLEGSVLHHCQLEGCVMTHYQLEGSGLHYCQLEGSFLPEQEVQDVPAEDVLIEGGTYTKRQRFQPEREEQVNRNRYMDNGNHHNTHLLLHCEVQYTNQPLPAPPSQFLGFAQGGI